MTYTVHRHADARAFLDRAEAWLLQAEAEYNLLIGIAHRLTESTEGYEPPIYLATVEGESGVVGCAYRTPPYKLGLTRMPVAAAPVLAEDVAAVYDALPAVLGPEREARAFAEAWSHAHGVEARPGMRQRIYRLDAVTPPEPWPPGRLRPATTADLDRVRAWFAAFNTDAGVATATSEAVLRQRLGEGALFFWETDEPVSLAGCAGWTPNGVRIGPVYTPPALRGRGYASAATAALSQRLLDEGRQFCLLYTDLSNPTSNSIYRRIGYRPVCDVMDYDFAEATGGA